MNTKKLEQLSYFENLSNVGQVLKYAQEPAGTLCDLELTLES